MKTLFLCVCVLVLATFSLADVKQRLRSAISSLNEDVRICVTENNLVPDDWYREPQITTNLHLQPENEQRTRRCGCTIACVLKRQNILEGSNIKETKFYEAIDNNVEEPAHTSEGRQLRQIIHKCIKEVKDIADDCDKSFSLYICVSKAVHVVQEHEEHEPEKEEEGEKES